MNKTTNFTYSETTSRVKEFQKFTIYMVIMAVSIAVSVVLLVLFWCFNGSVGFVLVFRWFQRFRSDFVVSVFWVVVHAAEQALDSLVLVTSNGS